MEIMQGEDKETCRLSMLGASIVLALKGQEAIYLLDEVIVRAAKNKDHPSRVVALLNVQCGR
jgi:hypothetical protein